MIANEIVTTLKTHFSSNKPPEKYEKLKIIYLWTWHANKPWLQQYNPFQFVRDSKLNLGYSKIYVHKSLTRKKKKKKWGNRISSLRKTNRVLISLIWLQTNIQANIAWTILK